MRQNIQVFVRCRPLRPQEKRSFVTVVPERREIQVSERSSNDTRNFHFDQVFGPDEEQVNVYNIVVRPLIEQVLLGFNCTVFAYGQTGTGKTYTMEGDRSDEELSWEEDPHCGIIPRAISQLFDILKNHDSEFTVRVSFLELYNEDAYDLLSSIDDTARLKIFDDAQKKGSVIVGGLEEIIVQSKSEIYEILKRGSAKRQTAATLLNACSSRSHTIFSVTVHIREGSIEGEELLKIGKLNLVDLAGSENIGRSGAQDKRAREAGNINQSLLTLGRVMTALVERRPHVPYRESKLTRLLQDSLGGKTKTSIIATISPVLLDLEDTLSTLDYASRAKKITNKPEMNQRLTKKALLREYTNEIERLRRDLQAAREKNGIYIEEENYKEMCNQLSAVNGAVKEKEDRLAALQLEADRNQKLFDEFTAQLEKARENCDKQSKIILAQQEREEKLAKVTADVTQDINFLHNKNERLEKISKENRHLLDMFHKETGDDISRLESMHELCSQENMTGTNSFFDKLNQSISTTNELNAEKFAQESKRLKHLAEQYQMQIDNETKMSQEYEALVEKFSSLVKECKVRQENIVALRDQTLRIASNFECQSQGFRSEDPSIKEATSEFRKQTDEIQNTWKATVKRELSNIRRRMDFLFARELKEDVKTGFTPQKKNYELPKPLDKTFEDIAE